MTLPPLTRPSSSMASSGEVDAALTRTMTGRQQVAQVPPILHPTPHAADCWDRSIKRWGLVSDARVGFGLGHHTGGGMAATNNVARLGL